MCEKSDVLTEEFTQKQLEYIANIEFIHEYPGHLSLDEILPDINSNDLRVFVLGKPKNWKDDIKNHGEILGLLGKEGISKLYLPNISGFTGVVCEDYQFDYFSKIGNLDIYNHLKTEGLIIPKQSAALFCTADCPTVVYYDYTRDTMIAFHAGLGSLVDLPMILTDQRSRFEESVIDDMVGLIEEPENYEIYIIGCISHNSFIYDLNDQKYGEGNKKILDHLVHNFGGDTVPFGSNHCGISLPNIIKRQFLDHGFDTNRIHVDDIDTHTDPRFWSHSESVKNGT